MRNAEFGITQAPLNGYERGSPDTDFTDETDSRRLIKWKAVME